MVIIMLMDEDENYLTDDKYEILNSCDDIVRIKIKMNDELQLNDNEKYILKNLLIQSVEYGANIELVKAYLRILWKLDKELVEENSINE